MTCKGPGLAALLGLAAAVAAGCSAKSSLPARLTGSGGSAGFGGADAGPCVDGQTRSCHVTLGQHNGVLSCYDGTETCQGGTWSACGDGSVSSRPGSGGSGRSTQSLSSPTPCQNNPCDPSCQDFNEQPDAGVTSDGGIPKFNWSGGTLTGYPSGLVNMGLTQPCSQGYDCQFNEYCQDPVTGSSCAHSKCQTGTGLAPDCDQCVSDICAVDPSCCTVPYTTSCRHDPCSTGSWLKSNCDSCVTTICSQDPYCCSAQGAWDSICVGEISSVCGKSCPLAQQGTWSQSCVDQVATVCDAKCGASGPGTCSHNPCTQGSALLGSCDSCVNQICSQDPYCCSTTWDSVCVDEVGSICNASCPLTTSVAPPEDGTCTPWLPGQTDSSCSGIDLSGGVPCNNTIPVCNHGTQTAPAGIRIINFPANSKQYPKCDPDQTLPQMYECFTSQPIPPGQCVSVTNCPGLTGQREIMINPPGAAHVAECSCQDNWTLYSGGTCGPPSCSGPNNQAVFKPLDLYFIVDKSGSMAGGKWTGATGALQAFFQDPNSAGIGAALEFFALSPGGVDGDGCGSSCSSAPCQNPMVPLGTLTAQSAPTDTQEQALVTALGQVSPGGVRPTYPALEGALGWATAQQSQNASGQYAVVLVTDGSPTLCDTNNNDFVTLASNAYVNSGVRTYAIALDGADAAALDAIAHAGGTGSALLVSGQDSNTVQTQMLAALQSIAANSASCTFTLPSTGSFDPNSATVTYTSSSGTTTSLPQVPSAGACGGGWYYDNNSSPAQITLCPSTCSTAKADPGSKVTVSLGCPKIYSPVTYTQIYQATCPTGSEPQWGYLAYDTTTPGDSSIQFDVRTAQDTTLLGSASFVSVATAQASPDTQICPMSGPAPCPVDLYPKLGQFNAINPYLELEVTLNPTSSGTSSPTLNNWQLSYSCPPAQ